MAQQLEIAAADQGGAAFDKADHHVAQRRGLPGFGGDALAAEENRSDLAIARAIRPAVGRLHHQAQTAALLRGHAFVGWHRATLSRLPQSDERLDTAKNVVIQRDQCGQRPAGIAIREEQHLSVGAILRLVADDDIAPLGAIATPSDVVEPASACCF